MASGNEQLREHLSKETSRRELHEDLAKVGLRKLTLDFAGLGPVTENDRPLIESFVAAAAQKDPRRALEDPIEVERIEIKKGKAIIHLKK